MNGWINHHCFRCGHPIEDGGGVIYVDCYELDRYQRERKELQANVSRNPEDETSLTVSHIFSTRGAARWYHQHYECLLGNEQVRYSIRVEELRTLEDVLFWSAHLYEKGWLPYTKWSEALDTWRKTLI